MDDLQQKVQKWFVSQGFPLEMEVARALTDAGFYVHQSEYYQDPQSHEYREIDLVSFANSWHGDSMYACSLVIECKVARDSPWVLFTGQGRPNSKDSVINRICSSDAVDVLNRLSHLEPVQELPLLRLPRRVGYGVNQALSDKKDHAYSACMTVAKAARVRAAMIDELDRRTSIKRFVDVLFPTVVVEGTLFEAFLDVNGQPLVEEVGQGLLCWRNPVGGHVETWIHIVTKHALPNFVEDVKVTADRLVMWMKEAGKPNPNFVDINKR